MQNTVKGLDRRGNLAFLVPLRYIPFSFIISERSLQQSIWLLLGKIYFKQFLILRDQCRSCLSGCMRLLSEHVCPCVFICIRELVWVWIIHKVKVLLWEGVQCTLKTYIKTYTFIWNMSICVYSMYPCRGWKIEGIYLVIFFLLPNTHDILTRFNLHSLRKEIVSLHKPSSEPSMKPQVVLRHQRGHWWEILDTSIQQIKTTYCMLPQTKII